MMKQMVLQRIAIGFATLLVVSIIVFVMTSWLPGDVAQIILGQAATPETLAALRAQLATDQPSRGFQLRRRKHDPSIPHLDADFLLQFQRSVVLHDHGDSRYRLLGSRDHHRSPADHPPRVRCVQKIRFRRRSRCGVPP